MDLFTSQLETAALRVILWEAKGKHHNFIGEVSRYVTENEIWQGICRVGRNYMIQKAEGPGCSVPSIARDTPMGPMTF